MRPVGPKFDAEGREWVLGRGSEPTAHQLRVWGSTVSFPSGFRAEPRPQIHFGPTKSLENASGGRRCRTHFFLLSTSGPAEPFDTTGGTLRFCGTPVKKHCYKR